MLNQNSLERENVECHETEYECDECDDDHDGDDKLASEPDVCTPSYHADCSSLTAATSTLSTPSLLHTCTLDPSKSISAAKTQDNDADLTVSNDVFETVDNSFNHMSNANIQNVNSGACSHADLLTSVSVPDLHHPRTCPPPLTSPQQKVTLMTLISFTWKVCRRLQRWLLNRW